jgi:flavin-dependent dehydrogenase
MDNRQITDVYGTDREYSFYANLEGHPGYGWIFPKKRTVNIGLGIVGSHSGGLPCKFRSFVRMLELKGMIPRGSYRSPFRGALVPTGGTVPRSYSNRCLLAGDSAGMVNPLTGGGIAYSFRAGRYAAKTLGTCIDDEHFDSSSLSRYETVWRADFGRGMKRLLLAQKLFTSPLTDLLFHIGSRDPGIQSIVAEGMSESNGSGVDLKQLAPRLVRVCLREALHVSLPEARRQQSDLTREVY